jgi:hypothetical protein
MSEHLPALGQPADDSSIEDDQDFADEHSSTVVDDDAAAGTDDTEAESPKGWSGLDRNTPP